MDREEAETYLEKRRSQGFTVIQATTLAIIDFTTEANPYGDFPLISGDPTRPATTPGNNPANASEYDYWDHVDYIVDRAAAKGMYIGFLPTWGKKVDPAQAINTEAKGRSFAKFVVQRYAAKKNIIWILGGDKSPAQTLSIWRGMAAEIEAVDAGRHLLTFHPPPGTSSAWFHNDSWLDFNMLQTGHGLNATVYNKVATDWAKTPAKPVMDGEPLYEDHPISFNPDNGYATAFDQRKSYYWAICAGAFGHCYGCHNVWQMYAPGHGAVTYARKYWYDSLDLEGAWDMLHLRNLMASRPTLKRAPENTLVTTSLLSGGDRIQPCRATDGSYAMVYSASGKAFTVSMSRIAGGTARGWWFDPRTGAATSLGTFPATGTRAFTPPSSGTDKDWLLVLDNASLNYPAPGSTTPPANQAPSISSQPQNTSAAVGQTATFSVTASGNPAPTYQWQKNGINISGATSPSYTTPATITADNGATFRVVVSNSIGSVTSSFATLTVGASVPIIVEASDPPAAKSSDVHRMVADSAASGGSAPVLDSNEITDFVTYRIDGLTGGHTYNMVIRCKKYHTRAIVKVYSQLSIAAGSAMYQQGNAAGYDLYSSGTAYEDLQSIPYTVSGTGTQTRYLRFEVSGKNPASTDYSISVDKITLTP